MKNLFTAFLLFSLTVTTTLLAGPIIERIICGSSTVTAGTTRSYVTLSHVGETFDWSVSGNATLTSPPNSMNATIRFNSIGSATVQCITSTGDVMTKVVSITSNNGGSGGSDDFMIDFETP